MKQIAVLLALAVWLPLAAVRAAEPFFDQQDLFKVGDDPAYNIYHIPGIVVTAKGSVLAWCEARKRPAGVSDWDDIRILLRRSTDDGKTWSAPKSIAEVPGPKAKNPFALRMKNVDPRDVTYNNPVLIADTDGTVHMLFCLEYMRCFYQRSDDDGQTWSAPTEITSAFEAFKKNYDWKVLATGPNHSIRLRTGRLVVPVWLSTGAGGNAHRPSVTATIYSDDRGQSWHAGEIAVPCTDEWINPNETVAVELQDGRVMLNVRSESKAHRRLVTSGPDGATGWSKPRFDDALLEPICMAGMVRYDHGGQKLILFSNPHNLLVEKGEPAPGRFRDRKNVSVKISRDEGRTWPVSKTIESGPSMYSDLAVTRAGTILCFYGRGTKAGFAGSALTLARFNLEWLTQPSAAQKPGARPNVLFIISDDLTSTALSCYGNKLCQTPNIDRLVAQGTRFTRAFCQGTYCGPSRASFMSGYYPHATGVLGYTSPRPAIGERATWSQHFKNAGYYTARVSKVYHMGVPGGIEDGGDGADDPASWTERFNSPGPEWKAPGAGETLEGNPDGQKPVVGGNTFVVVEADGDDLVHSDGKTAAKAVELIERHAGEPFFLAVGFVRPHVPFVAPAQYFEPFKPYEKLPLPPKLPGDWDDIPRAGINYKTSLNMKMDERRQRKAIGGYYAAVRYMDAQVGKVLDALEKSGQADNTIVIFTSDHGYHLGEHDFWAKVSLRDESALVPLIVKVPGKQPAVCHSLVELLDLFPTTATLCGLEWAARLQGKDLSRMFDDPTHRVREAAFSVAPSSKGFLLREDRWAYLQYGEDGALGAELFDMTTDPHQFTNLADKAEFAAVKTAFRAKLAEKLRTVRENDLKRRAN